MVKPPDPQKLAMNIMRPPIVASNIVVLRVFFMGFPSVVGTSF
jgi:hypothetical protein